VTSTDIRQLLTRAPLVDGHNDLLWQIRTQADGDFSRLDVGARCPSLHTDLPRLRRGRVGGQFWSVYVPADLPGPAAVTATLEQLDTFHRMLDRYPDRLALARSADDIELISSSGRIASLAGIEGGHCIGDSLGALRAMHRLGAAYLTLTHTSTTTWADSATDEPRHGGLADFGRRVVAELNRVGMLVDLSHTAPTTMAGALACTEAPAIFSHSGARGVCDHPRNVPDAVLAQLPGNGGVCMVTFVPGFVDPRVAEIWLASDAEEQRLRAELPDAPEVVERRLADWRAAHPAPAVTIARVADHVDRVRAVAGIAHVGIGSDFDGVSVLPDGLGDASTYPALFDELRGRGYSDDDLMDIAGRNVLRVMRDAGVGRSMG
jgi:membrane dipeptidase